MNVSRPIRVFCVDDNRLLTEALRSRISIHPDLEWAGASHGGSSISEILRRAKPDVVLMDIDMPGVDTFVAVESLAREAPGVRAVMFSGYVLPHFITRAIDCGAWGYLSKNDDVVNLISAIRRVGQGEIAFSRDVEIVYRRAIA